ncbi:hypothetical protein HD554DRAFT_1827253 [Boletus coccyginus]|nr:hypothetical protein HD554DRAFT_1827253 [Boletus coccyginus]
MPSSSATTKTEEVLEKVLQTIREEYENPFPVLSETDRNRFIREEESLREQLKETIELDSSGSSWRDLFSLPSPRAAKCLQEAEELHQRIKKDINAKLRTRLTGKSNPPSPSNRNGQGSVLNLMGARTPETGSGLSLADDNPEPASEPDINNPLGMSSESGDRSRDNSVRRHRGLSPPPPPQRTGQSGSSSETSSQSSDFPRHSQPARPPPRSTGGFSNQPHGYRPRGSEGHTSETNCVHINNSNADGMTVNHGGLNNSGAVIHTTMMPTPCLPQHVPRY